MTAENKVTWNQVAAFRLARHHLSECAPLKGAPTKALVSVVNDMAGAQAQLLSAAQISLWSRVRDLQIAHIEADLNERTLVKAACMRSTLFLVPAEQYAPGSRTPIAEAQAILLHTATGFVALSTTCPHLGCTVETAPEGFVCPCHNSRFAPDGTLLQGPATRSLTVLRVERTAQGHLRLHTD